MLSSDEIWRLSWSFARGHRPQHSQRKNLKTQNIRNILHTFSLILGTPKHTYSHTNSPSISLTHTHTHVHTCSYIYKQTHIHKVLLRYLSPTHKLQTHTRTHAHTRTNTQVPLSFTYLIEKKHLWAVSEAEFCVLLSDENIFQNTSRHFTMFP